ncbi:E3 ubiquitin-protein ligase ZNF598-like [Dermacentor andersoni]|uniref:E3 ubiquitin-protein ligase ZNF598-like n=1 Tax=Dermacentor andersoni TaxID=34620 RepID=UPI002155F42D|nr:E3 ubiquitin-protein ligase ZNF598-like [Dermacentor andersoni]
MDVKEDDNVCIVCWREIHVYAIGLCDHPVCHECSTRMRVLCRKSECPICRRNLPKVIFVKECRPYEELNKRLYQVDVRPHICFEDESVRQAYRELLDNRCKYCPLAQGKPAPIFSNFGMLRNHVRKEHNRTYCDLCVEHLKIFPCERTAYTRRDMARHLSQGDLDDTSHKGHPLCKFCDMRYFDNDELYRHLRRDHYYCHFCGDDYRLQYYRNYEYLRAHFREEHFLCEEGDCRNETFTAAFRSEIDLKAHRAQQHNRSLTKAQAKQARTLDLEFAVTPRANSHSSSGYHDDSGSYGRRPLRQPRSGRGPPPDTSRDEQMARNLQGVQSRSQGPQNLNMTWELQPPVDYRCEKEFPQLGSDGAAAASSTSTSSGHKASVDPFPVAASSYPPRKPDKVNVNSVDEFPSLNPSSSSATQQVPAMPQTAMVSLRKAAKAQAKGQANGIPPGRGSVTKQQPQQQQQQQKQQQKDANNNGTGGKSVANWLAQASGDRGSVKPQLPMASVVVTARPAPEPSRANKPASKASSKMALEEDFPTLATRSIARISISSSPTPPPQSEPPWNSGKLAKTKKKKRGEETKQTESSQPPPTAEINNNSTDSTAKASLTVTRKQPSETSTESTAPSTAAPTNNLLQLIAAARKGTTIQAPPTPTPELASDGDTSDSDERPPRLTVSDFPCLNGRPTATAAPPPGFGKPKPPPGFARPSACDAPMGTLSSLVTTTTTPASPAVPPQYMPPAGFPQRNLSLIQDVQQILAKRSEDGLFAKFKSLSGSFRQGVLTADEYFARCIELFGSEKEFIAIFPELLFLLPDIRKQQELMATFNAHRRAQAATSGALPKGSPVQLLVCATCQQVLSAEDFRSHRTVHDPS